MRIEALEPSAYQNTSTEAITAAKWHTTSPQDCEPPGHFASSHRAKKTKIQPNGPQRTQSLYQPPTSGLTDFRLLAKLLRVGENKLFILGLLQRRDWIKLLQLLPKHLLVNALRLFNKEKLLRLLMYLPKPMLLKVVLHVLKIPDLIKRMPTAELLRILRSKKLQNRELSKGIMQLQPQFILLLLQRLYGNYDYSKLKAYDLFRIFMQTSKMRLLEALKTMPFKVLQQLVTNFVKQDPELLLLMSDRFMMKLLAKMTKNTLIQGCEALPPNILIQLLSQLPDPLLLLAAAQIDDKTLEDYLISEHGDLLLQLAGAA